MKKHDLILFSIFLLSAQILIAQTRRADSLLHLAEKSSGIEQARLYNNAAKALFSSNPEASVTYAEKAMEVSKKVKNAGEEYHSLVNIGIAYSYMGRNEQALKHHQQALEMFGETIKLKQLSSLHNELGIDYKYMGNYEKALEHFLMSLEIKEQILVDGSRVGSDREIATSMHNIGLIFDEIGNHENAIDYYMKSLEKKKIIGDSAGMARSYNNIGTVFEEDGEFEKALENYSAALELKKRHCSRSSVARTLGNIGVIHFDLGDFQTAVEYNLKALNLHEEFGDEWGQANMMNSIDRTYLKMKEPDNAVQYLRKGLSMAKSIKAIDLLSNSYEFMAQYHAMEGDFKKAYEFKNEFIVLNDSLYDVEMATRITELETMYETEKKAQEIKLLTRDAQINTMKIKRQRTQLYSIAGIMVLLVLVSVLLFMWYREKQRQTRVELEKKNLETEQKLLRAQINPHFIFNALNSIQSYISANDGLQAMTYLAKFSQLMRNILENSRKSMIILEEEIDTITLYMELEAMRFNKNFDFKVSVHPDLIPAQTHIPPMLIQPFVENSIKHGFRNLDKHGHLRIAFEKNNGTITCVVNDNGIGREQAMKNNPARDRKHVSLGMQVTSERLSAIGKARKVDAGFIIDDLKTTDGKNEGTRVTMQLPYELE